MAACRLALFVVAMAAGCLAQTDRIWTIAVGHDWGAYEYFDDAGYLKGFSLQMIDLVCGEARMDCRIVWDKYSNCWDSTAPGQHPAGGVGLMSSWYDACTGWIPTVERIHTFAFSTSYLQMPPANFWVVKGTSFDPSNLRRKTIGFLDGWATTEQCIARQTSIQNNILEPSQIKHIAYPEQLLTALINREVDAAFTDTTAWNNEQLAQLERVGSNLNCNLDGNAMMTRKDSPFINFWNVGFAKLRDGSKWNRFCDETNIEHTDKGQVMCKQM